VIWRVLLAGLWVAVLCSALAVVYAVHRNRAQFVQLQQAQRERDQLNVEWGQLQLEQSAWATHGRIEQAARDKLDMKTPDSDDIVVVRP